MARSSKKRRKKTQNQKRADESGPAPGSQIAGHLRAQQIHHSSYLCTTGVPVTPLPPYSTAAAWLAVCHSMPCHQHTVRGYPLEETLSLISPTDPLQDCTGTSFCGDKIESQVISNPVNIAECEWLSTEGRVAGGQQRRRWLTGWLAGSAAGKLIDQV